MNTTHHQRRADHYTRQSERRAGLWFVIGFTMGLLLTAAWFAPMARAAAPANQQTLGGRLEPAMPHPNVIRAILRIGACEQPAPSGSNYYAGIRWDAYPGKTWPGGLGIMAIHHLQVRAPGTPADPTKATPAQQIRVAWRAYKHYRRIYGVAGGATFWVCSSRIGFGGVLYDNQTVVWR